MKLYWKDKDTGNFMEYGEAINFTNLPYGIWMITRDEYSTSCENLLIKLSNIPNYIEIKDFLKVISLEPIIKQTIAKARTSHSAQEISQKICKEIYKKYRIKKDKTIRIRD